MNAKRTSLKQAGKSPLDELFKKVQDEEEIAAPVSAVGKKGLEGFKKEIKEKKREQIRKRQKAQKELEKARIKARETGKAVTRTTSLIMYGYQHEWLDMKTIEAMAENGKKIKKAEIIRALVDFAIDIPFDLSGIKSESDIQTRIKQGIKKARL